MHKYHKIRTTPVESLSARRAWIEIGNAVKTGFTAAVALREESVDRNSDDMRVTWIMCWSLSARRAWIEISGIGLSLTACGSLSARRAWIEIADALLRYAKLIWSLSARRAWIEIKWPLNTTCHPRVALREESVDRNSIEVQNTSYTVVALREESVDRNIHNRIAIIEEVRRSPRGERG